MNELPEGQANEQTPWRLDDEPALSSSAIPAPEMPPAIDQPAGQTPASETPFAVAQIEPEYGPGPDVPCIVEPPVLYDWSQPQVQPPARIPHLGHLFLLIALLLGGFLVSIAVFYGAFRLHLFGVSSIQDASNDIHFILGTEAVIYLVTFCLALAVFPPFWHESLFAGLQWNGATARRLIGRLIGVAFFCFLLAWLNSYLVPSPSNTPIEKVFKTPGAPWLLFGFGVTFAPFFEEMFFRGFLLPALCTAYDWIVERIKNESPRPLGEDGHPHWSLAAMIVGAVATSIPFAALHAEQTGYSIGPFLLLVGVSLVLCAVRLLTRSLAASTLVHASYNFMLFSLMLAGTGGFRHLDKM
jgi:uncharacterized protein